MAILKSSFNGARLKAARQYNAMTIGDVAHVLGISNQSISQFENNKAEPKLENIFLLSNLLGFPREYFYERDDTNITIGNTYFRSLASTSKKERNAQVERVKLLSKIYAAIQNYITFPEFDLKMQDDMAPEELADYVREQWEELGRKPIYNLIDVMEKHGIVITNAFEDNKNIDAYSHVEIIDHKVVPIVILGYETNIFRQQFNAAHELGHILTDGQYELEELSKAEYRDMEKYMNRFAGALLMPEEMLLEDLRGNGN
jgi:transcriptional regulator with XRE-family HTH domain